MTLYRVSWGMGYGKTPVHFSSAAVVLRESFTYGKCFNLPMLLLCWAMLVPGPSVL